MARLRLACALPAAALILAGCDTSAPVAPGQPAAGDAVQFLSCEVDVRSGDLSCSGGDSLPGEGALGAVIGGQGVYVHLSSSNVGYDAGSTTFHADVTIRNVANQPIGTPDDIKVEGIRIFFTGAPTTIDGTGQVTVGNADATDDFTATNQPYFHYGQALAPGRTSLPRTWEWNVPETVVRFGFEVGVSAPVPDEGGFEPGIKFVQAKVIDADSLHTCGIRMTGEAYCWGYGNYGRLGDGQTTAHEQLEPRPVEQGSLRFVSIGTGLNHTCALSDLGEAYCWGHSDAGRLGSGDNTHQAVPRKVLGGHRFIQLIVGRRHNCGLKEDGTAWCWGANANGELGDGTLTSRPEPTQVVGGHKFIALGAGNYHTCGIVEGGDAYCWGSSTNGKVGGPARGAVPEPELVPGGHKFVRVAGMYHMSCGITAEGEAWCWGANVNGKLGDGTEDSSPDPVRVAGDIKFVEIYGGSQHNCGLAYDGRVYCWGSRINGTTGNGSTASGKTLVPTEIVGDMRFVAIESGNDHSCGITWKEELFCWGNGERGKLGTGNTSSTGTPTPPPGIIVVHSGEEPCGIEGATDSCFQRRSFAESVLMASRRAIHSDRTLL